MKEEITADFSSLVAELQRTSKMWEHYYFVQLEAQRVADKVAYGQATIEKALDEVAESAKNATGEYKELYKLFQQSDARMHQNIRNQALLLNGPMAVLQEMSVIQQKQVEQARLFEQSLAGIYQFREGLATERELTSFNLARQQLAQLFKDLDLTEKQATQLFTAMQRGDNIGIGTDKAGVMLQVQQAFQALTESGKALGGTYDALLEKQRRSGTLQGQEYAFRDKLRTALDEQTRMEKASTAAEEQRVAALRQYVTLTQSQGSKGLTESQNKAYVESMSKLLKVSEAVGIQAKELDNIWTNASGADLSVITGEYTEVKKVLFDIIAMEAKWEAERKRSSADDARLASLRNYISTKQVSASTLPTGYLEQYVSKLGKVQAIAESLNISTESLDAEWRDVVARGLVPATGEMQKLQEAIIAVERVTQSYRTAQQEGFIATGKEVALLRQKEDAARAISKWLEPTKIYQGTPIGNQVADLYSRIKAEAIKLRLETEQISSVWGSVLSKQLPVETSHQRIYKLMAALVELTSDYERKILGAAAATAKVTANTAVATQQTKELKQSVAQTVLGWRGLMTMTGSHLLYRMISMSVTALQQGSKELIDIQRSIAEIQTIDAEKMPFGFWLEATRELSNTFGLPIKDQIEGVYETISNQIAMGAEAVQFMYAANTLAITSVSSVTDSVNLLSSAINAYGMNTTDATELSAQFFKTIELGRVRASEMANTFGRVAVIASQLNVNIAELDSMIATLTINGVKTSEAFTQIRNILIKLLKPTDEMKKFLASINAASGPAAIATYGLGGVFIKLEEYTRGSNSELAEMFNNLRGLPGIMSLLGSGLVGYTKNLQKITDAQTDYASKSEIIFTNSGKKIEQQMQTLKNYFTTTLGQTVLTTIVQISDALGGVEKNLGAIGEVLKMGAMAGFSIMMIPILSKTAAWGKALSMTTAEIKLMTNETERLAMSQTRASAIFSLKAGAIVYILTTIAKESLEGFQNWATGQEAIAQQFLNTWEKTFTAQALAHKNAVLNMESDNRKIIDDSTRLIMLAQALSSGVDFKRNASNADAFSESLEASGIAITLAMKDAADSVKALGDQYKKTEDAAHDLALFASDNLRESNKLAFEFKLEDTESYQKKLDLVASKIREITDQSHALLSKDQMTKDDSDLYQDLTKQAKEYYALRKKLADEVIEHNKRVNKELRELDADKAKADREYEKTRREAEFDIIKAASKKKGDKEDPEKLAEAQKRLNELTINHQEKLDEIAEKRKELKIQRVEEIDHEKAIVDFGRQEAELAAQKVALLREELAIQKQFDKDPAVASDGLQRLKDLMSQIQDAFAKGFKDVEKPEQADKLLSKWAEQVDKAQDMFVRLSGQYNASLATMLDDYISLGIDKRAEILAKLKAEDTMREGDGLKAANKAASGEVLRATERVFDTINKLGRAGVRMQSLTKDMADWSPFDPKAAARLAFQTGEAYIASREKIAMTLATEYRGHEQQIPILKQKLELLKGMIAANEGGAGQPALIAEAAQVKRELDTTSNMYETVRDRYREVREEIDKARASGGKGYMPVESIVNAGSALKAAADALAKDPTDPSALLRLKSLRDLLQELGDNFRKEVPQSVPDDVRIAMSELQQSIREVNKLLGETPDSFFEQIKAVEMTERAYKASSEGLKQWWEGLALNMQGVSVAQEDAMAAMNTYNAGLETLRERAEAAYGALYKLSGQMSVQSTINNSNTPKALPLPGQAQGGLSRGVDTIPTLLQAGEFVLNKRATQVMYSQLIGMNSGLRRMSGGGSVTLNGGVNVSMSSSGNAQADARAVAQAIRREIRRGTINAW